MTVRYDFDGEVAVVSGAGAGIGRAVALRLASAGARLVLNDIDPAALEESQARCAELGVQVVGQAGDIADAAVSAKIAQAAVERFGQISMLVNNAGMVRIGQAVSLAHDDWRRVIDVNLSGAFFLSQACAPAMIARATTGDRRGNGKVVNIASIDGLMGAALQSNYSAAKAGLIGLTMALAREWARHRINVNALAPGLTDTAMSAPLLENPDLRDSVLAQIPLRRCASPDEIAGAALFLLSSESDYVTGQTLSVCGGLRMAP